MFSLTSRSDAAQPAGQSGTALPAPADYEVDWRRSLRLAERACCCSARPSIAVIMPSRPGRPHATELLLCGHHYQRSEKALRNCAAAAFTSDGRPLTADAWLLALRPIHS